MPRELTVSAASVLVLAGVSGEADATLPGPRSRAGGYVGRYMVGRRVPLGVRTVGPGSIPGTPTTPPVAEVYAEGGDLAGSFELPAVDPGSLTGSFARAIRPGAGWGLGSYRVVYRYELGAFSGAVVETFDLVAGDAGGAVISLHAHDRPEARYVLAQLDGGTLVQGRNPRL